MSTPPRWSRVARSDEMKGPGPHAASADGIDLVVLRTKDGLKAFEGRCPHQGALLGEGELDGDALVCRNHRWRFSIDGGKREGGPQCLRACPVREHEGDIQADVRELAEQKTADDRPHKKVRDLPGPRPLPIVGNAFMVDPKRLHLQLEQWGREFGTPYRYKFGPRDVVVFSDLDALQPVLRARPEGYSRGSNLQPAFRSLGVSGVFSAEGDAWRPQRRLAMEALSHRHLRTFYPTLATVAERLVARWTKAARSGDALDIADELKRFTVDVTTQLVFGYDIDTLGKGDDVIQRKLELIFPMLNKRLASIVPWWKLFKLPADRRVDRVIAEMRAWLLGLVADARKALAADPSRAERPANFLEAMLTARDERGEPFDDDVIFGNAMTMLLAGEDTTAYTLAWCVHHLLDAPESVRSLREEIDRELAGARVPANIESANRLAFAGAIANEAMRLRPVAPLFFLEPLQDAVVQDVALPKGTLFVTLNRAESTRAENFGAPTEFRPARWIDPEATGGAHEPGASLPFGSGPRICPGRTLALLEMKIVLGALYKNFDVERVGSAGDVHELFSFTMMPTGLSVRLRARA